MEPILVRVKERLKEEGADFTEDMVVKLIEVIFDEGEKDVLAGKYPYLAPMLSLVKIQLLASADHIDGKDDPGR